MPIVLAIPIHLILVPREIDLVASVKMTLVREQIKIPDLQIQVGPAATPFRFTEHQYRAGGVEKQLVTVARSVTGAREGLAPGGIILMAHCVSSRPKSARKVEIARQYDIP